MQLWKKNYLISLAIILILLSAGTSILVNVVFYTQYQQEIQNTLTESNTLVSILSADAKAFSENDALYYLGENLAKDQKYIQLVSEDGEVLADSFPFSFQKDFQKAALRRHEDIPYLITSGRLRLEDKTWHFYYGKNIQALYQTHRIQLLSSFGIFLLLLCLTGTVLFLAMKKIYRPISQISHELRNPLTVIQGYAQYLRAGSLTEEDRCFAEDQLIREAARLRKITDTLLIMGNLKNEKIKTQKLSMDALLRDLQNQYPRLKIHNQIDKIYGDETLLKSLLGNLISNAFQHDAQVKLTASQNQIIVWNGGPPIAPAALQILNKKREPHPSVIKGWGIGLVLCRDILHLYKGRLIFRVPPHGGTEAVITLPETMVSEKKASAPHPFRE